MGYEKAGWSPTSRKLAMALELHESSLCSGCGHSLEETTEQFAESWYEAEELVCGACRAVGKKTGDKERGKITHAVSKRED